METHIRAFNKKIEGTLTDSSNDDILNIIEEYQREINSDNYYNSLDQFGFKIGIEYRIQLVVDKNYKLTGYIPSVKYSHGNPLKKSAGIYPLIDKSSPYKSEKKAYEYLAKEYIYILKRVLNLRALVLKQHSLNK